MLVTRFMRKRSTAVLTYRALSSYGNMESSVPVSKRGELRTMLADIAKRKDAALAVSRDGEIDWATYEKTIGADEVAKIKKEFEAHQYTDFSADAKSALSDLDAKLAETKEALNAEQESMAQYCADAEHQRDHVLASYTTEDTTLEDVLARHPDLDAKYDRQIEEHDWDTDNVDVADVAAKRIALMEERWDASVMGGKLDENAQKEMIAEMETLASKNQSGDAQMTLESVDASIREYINEMADFYGEPHPSDEQLAKIIELNRGELSDAEKAIVEEPKLFDLMDHYNAMGVQAKVKSLQAHYDSLEANEELVVDETWRATQASRAAQEPPVERLGEFCVSELEGKSADEIEAMADEAADNNEWWRATQILMHQKKSTGEIDALNNDVNTFGGMANYMEKVAHGMMAKVKQ